MAKFSDQVRSSDLTFWGFFALICWAIAVFAANVSALVPDGVLGGLHVSRLDGGSFNQMRADIAALESESAELRQANTALLQRFMVSDQASGDAARRLGAIELALPGLIEAANANAPVDRNAVTAGIGGTPQTLDVPGGTVSVTTSPLTNAATPADASSAQPMPEALLPSAPDSGAYGIALGPPIAAGDGPDAWDDMNAKVGTLLLGLTPLVANLEGGPGKRLVAGPLISEAAARQLCGQIAKAGIACSTVPFVGTPVAMN